MTRRSLFVLALGTLAVAASAIAAQRQWQTGTWHDYTVERPKLSFSIQPRDPNSTLPRTTPAREIRTYVVDTRTHRLELRQDATADTPRIDAIIGQTVQLAVEKKTVYIKDADGKEHKLSLRKQTELKKLIEM